MTSPENVRVLLVHQQCQFTSAWGNPFREFYLSCEVSQILKS